MSLHVGRSTSVSASRAGQAGSDTVSYDLGNGATPGFARQLAEIEDVDVAEAIMDLQVEAVAYQATLQALQRSLPETLVAFLRR